MKVTSFDAKLANVAPMAWVGETTTPVPKPTALVVGRPTRNACCFCSSSMRRSLKMPLVEEAEVVEARSPNRHSSEGKRGMAAAAAAFRVV